MIMWHHPERLYEPKWSLIITTTSTTTDMVPHVSGKKDHVKEDNTATATPSPHIICDMRALVYMYILIDGWIYIYGIRSLLRGCWVGWLVVGCWLVDDCPYPILSSLISSIEDKACRVRGQNQQ